MERYFVARLGRERGYRGAELTTFVEQAYQSGLAKFAIEAGMASGPRQVALSQVRDWLIDDSLKTFHRPLGFAIKEANPELGLPKPNPCASASISCTATAGAFTVSALISPWLKYRQGKHPSSVAPRLRRYRCRY